MNKALVHSVMKGAIGARKGRGAISNRSGRFEAQSREGFDDGWDRRGNEDPPPLRTEVLPDKARTIFARNDSPDIPFDRSINPYRGCEHGCIYCFARPSHAYLGLSAGLDFETRLFAKHDAPTLLRAALCKPSYEPRTVALGANTDPYQPIEKRLGLTRQILEVLAESHHPVCIVTKSHLVTRDIDLLQRLAAEGAARVCLSITTLDRGLARRLEPRAPTPSRRLATLWELSQAGIPVSVLAAPMIPAVNDVELEAILEAARDAGAESAGYVMLRLPLEIAGLFEEWLDTHLPDRKKRVLSLMRQSRGGNIYDSTWGKRMRGEGPYAQLIASRFALACKRLGINKRRWDLNVQAFRAPAADARQMSLL